MQVKSRYKRLRSKQKGEEDELNTSMGAEGYEVNNIGVGVGGVGGVGGMNVPNNNHVSSSKTPSSMASSSSSSSTTTSALASTMVTGSPSRVGKRQATSELVENSPHAKRSKGRGADGRGGDSSLNGGVMMGWRVNGREGGSNGDSSLTLTSTTPTPSTTNPTTTAHQPSSSHFTNNNPSRSNSPIHRSRQSQQHESNVEFQHSEGGGGLTLSKSMSSGVGMSSSGSGMHVLVGNLKMASRASSSDTSSVGATNNNKPKQSNATTQQSSQPSSSSSSHSQHSSFDDLQRHVDSAVEQALSLKEKLFLKIEEEMLDQIMSLRSQVDDLTKDLLSKDSLIIAKETSRAQLMEHISSELRTALCESEMQSRVAIREKLAQDSSRLGYPSFGRNGEEFREGVAAKMLREREVKLEEKKVMFEALKKKMSKRKTSLSVTVTLSSSSMNIDVQPSSPNNGGGFGESGSANLMTSSNSSSKFHSPFFIQPQQQSSFMTPEREMEDILMQEQLIKLKLAGIKSEEQELVRERESLRVETQLHYKELRRFQEEEMSKFNGFPVLHERYLMLQLLGRGGFSEVYRAYDLKLFRQVACKIHQLSHNWATEKKASYLRHAERECEIHTSLVHPRIVALYDVFEIDENTFCTVMEFCKGGDLDSYLKQHKSLPEMEARVLTAQLFDGLRYLMSREKDKLKIIHYDLKPGNLLFDENGNLKIADFGLSKIMDTDSESMELTSQGAGTYWYLPPECFDPDKPKISGKVDVWSAGVILFQMLFASKPFGNNISQKHILERNLIHSNLKVEFPSSRKVSDEAKNFLSKCLTPNVNQRPDAIELASHPFLSFLSTTSSSVGSGTNTTSSPQKRSLSSLSSTTSSYASNATPSSPAGSSKMGPPTVRVASLASSQGSTTTNIGGGTFTLVRK
jgi:tousled-like kinase